MTPGATFRPHKANPTAERRGDAVAPSVIGGPQHAPNAQIREVPIARWPGCCAELLPPATRHATIALQQTIPVHSTPIARAAGTV
jgi:hypothetical protein